MKTTFENPDPNEHNTLPCSRCGKDTCVCHLYITYDKVTQTAMEQDICYRCAGRYPIGCDCEEQESSSI